MEIKFDDLKLNDSYWIYTGDINNLIDFMLIGSKGEHQIECYSKNKRYYPFRNDGFVFFDNELEVRQYAKFKLIPVFRENIKKISIITGYPLPEEWKYEQKGLQWKIEFLISEYVLKLILSLLTSTI